MEKAIKPPRWRAGDLHPDEQRDVEGEGRRELVAEAANDVAQAKEHGILIVRADVAGTAGELVSYGSSAIVAPNGRVLATGDVMTEGLIGTEI